MSWNTQKVEDLKKLWNEGVATSRIGEQLGFTKNAVIGKAFRLGLERRQNSRKKTSQNQQFSSVTMYPVHTAAFNNQIEVGIFLLDNKAKNLCKINKCSKCRYLSEMVKRLRKRKKQEESPTPQMQEVAEIP